MFTVAIIGRPNVGKSTLYNRLTGTKHALVHDMPGVTRDRREGVANIADLEFRIIDTAGLEEGDKESLQQRMTSQTDIAADEADVCMMLVDGRAGLIPEDKHFANRLRKKNKPVILVVNKCEGSHGDHGFHESLSLGFEHTLMLSAEHGEGLGELYHVLSSYKETIDADTAYLEIGDDASQDKAIQIAIMGRPNAGKSTLLNSLLGQERTLTGPEAGITRDSIAIDWQFEGHAIRLIDTAGIRRKSNVKQTLEKLSVGDSLRALRFAHVAILLIDATSPLEKQDLMIAELIIKEGRMPILAINKWDLIKGKEAWLEELHYKIDELLPAIKNVTVITSSALQNKRVTHIIKAALKSYEVWNKRISTAKLNEWLRRAESEHLPPLGKNNRRIRLKYITQGNTRPPSFTLFLNRPTDLPESYKRYLINNLRKTFGLDGSPIRLMLRASTNPYSKK